MKLRLFLVSLFILALAVPGFASAQAPYLVTGGGQVVADSSDASSLQGPGDTIAFVARQRSAESDAADGSLQVVNTSEAREGQRPSIIYNGQVTCLRAEGENEAIFGGQRRAGEGPEYFFVRVVDTGDDERGTDLIEFRETNPDEGENPCDDDGSGTLLKGTTLARGNAKVDTARSGR